MVPKKFRLVTFLSWEISKKYSTQKRKLLLRAFQRCIRLLDSVNFRTRGGVNQTLREKNGEVYYHHRVERGRYSKWPYFRQILPTEIGNNLTNQKTKIFRNPTRVLQTQVKTLGEAIFGHFRPFQAILSHFPKSQFFEIFSKSEVVQSHVKSSK